MTIEENLALAAGSGGLVLPHDPGGPRAVPGPAGPAGHGAGGPDESSLWGLLSGGQRQALTLLMSTMVPPWLLMLDEHTAALDPATAEKVLAITRQVVEEHHITTMMVTHNMHDALSMGNRTLMMDGGRIVLDVKGEERRGMTVDDLLRRFRENVGKGLDNDRILLS